MAVKLNVSSGSYNVRQSERQREQHPGSKLIRCKVQFLDDSEGNFETDKQAKGQVLLDKVFEHLELVEKDYFGLQFVDNSAAEQIMRWIDPVKLIRKQVAARSSALSFHFRVKFYVSDPAKLKEEYTRYHMFLQLKKDLLEGRLLVPYQSATLLASYAVQSELGDFNAEEHSPGYLSVFRFVPNQTEQFELDVAELHRLHRGQTPADAEFKYLDHARRLDMYGTFLFAAQQKDKTGREIQLGVTSGGLIVFQNNLRINWFSWSQIVKISFKRNQFFIQLHKDAGDKSETLIGFNMSSYQQCKHLWKACIEHHTFFRLHSCPAPPKSGLFSFQSKFRYSGRTEHESTEEMKKHRRVERSFTRSPSKRFARRTVAATSRDAVAKSYMSQPAVASNGYGYYGNAAPLQTSQNQRVGNAKRSSLSEVNSATWSSSTRRTNPAANGRVNKYSLSTNHLDSANDAAWISASSAAKINGGGERVNSTMLHSSQVPPDNGMMHQTTALAARNGAAPSQRISMASSQRMSTASSGDFTASPTKIDYRRVQSAERAGRSRPLPADEPAHTVAAAVSAGNELRLSRPLEPSQNGVAEYRLSRLVDPSYNEDVARYSQRNDIRNSGEYHNPKMYSSRANFAQMSSDVPVPQNVNNTYVADVTNPMTGNSRGGYAPSNDVVDDHNLVTVRIKPDAQGRFGFNVKGGADQCAPVIVSRVAVNTPADLCIPRLNEGDQILSINNQDVSSLTHDEVVKLCRSLRHVKGADMVLVVRPNVYTTEEDPADEADVHLMTESAPAVSMTTGSNMLTKSLQQLQEGLDNGTILTQFEKVYRSKHGMTMNIAHLPENQPKNRYRDISPYDLTRVKLQAASDYINANFVNMEIARSGIVNRYIAAQGPLPSTSGDFWLMVWQQNSSLIIMLTTESERGRVKCHQYWPNIYAGPVVYGSIKVTTVKEELTESFAFREFTISSVDRHTMEEHSVQQIQYLLWPDHGVPQSCGKFLDFVVRVRQMRTGMVEPTVVHCSAGIGRTGVLITMETAMCLIEANEPVYPLILLRQMRDQRAMLIQNAVQFRFVCEAILRAYNEKVVRPLDEYRMQAV